MNNERFIFICIIILLLTLCLGMLFSLQTQYSERYCNITISNIDYLMEGC